MRQAKWSEEIFRPWLKTSTRIFRKSSSSFTLMPYHQMVLKDQIPLSFGGGIEQARTFMYLLRTAHLGEVTVTVWPKQLKEICESHNIKVLD